MTDNAGGEWRLRAEAEAQVLTTHCPFGCIPLCKDFNTNVCQVFTAKEFLDEWKRKTVAAAAERDRWRALAEDAAHWVGYHADNRSTIVLSR